MTQVVFDVVDLVGEVHPGDTVSVWPPYVSSTVDGRVRSTRKIDVLVDEGPVTREVEPGPLVVQLQCRGIADTKPRTVTVPDEGTITLANLLQSTFTYTPAVVSQVARDAAAAAAAAATVGDAQAVLDARDDTVAAVATLGDAQTVLTARDAAVAAAEDAEQIATTLPTTIQSELDARLPTELDTRIPPLVADAIAAEPTIVDAAAAAVGPLAQGAVDAALAGSQHYSGTGFPNGVVAAPVGSIYTDTAATAGAIRWIKASGTGNTGWRVTDGNTGVRNITAAAVGGTASDIAVARIGQMVTVSAASFRPATTGTVGVVDLPSGFRPTKNSSGSAVESNTVRPVFALRYAPYRVEVRNVGTVNSYVDFTTTFITEDPWPTTLPGTPA